MYEVLVDDLGDESLTIAVTYYVDGEESDQETGTYTITEGTGATNFTHFMMTLNDASPRRARVVIKPR